jgi:type IV pilus assembly protein PilV
MLNRFRHASGAQGFGLLEILVTLLIAAFGLLGLATLQMKIQSAGLESLQRSQALLLIQDMVSRINANRVNAADYAVTLVGTGDSLDYCDDPDTIAKTDLCEWRSALKGEFETKGIGDDQVNVGGVVGGRGCIELTAAGPPVILRVSVAWQGFDPTVVPTLSCAENAFNGTDADGVTINNEKLRRVVSYPLTIAKLD